MDRVRIGVLGAAKIVPSGLLMPAREVPQVEVVALAARDRRRAEAFAARYGIPRVLPEYAAVVADPDIDAIYVPLPNGLHGRWTIAALEAGKHVLCEKPFAANAHEAEQMARAAERAGRLVMEAFHYRYHPLAARMRSIVASGMLGRIQRIETNVCFPLLNPWDIRYRLDLAGGATMDAGTYTINMLRFLADGEPTVVEAHARLMSPQVDRYMQAEFRLPDGGTGRITCSLLSSTLLNVSARVLGDRGELRAINPVLPHRYHRLTVITPEGKHVEQLSQRPTYLYQLQAFARALVEGAPIPTGPADAVANMRVIDAVYEAAGLRPRAPTAD
jgi:predicted dehydrogenase